MKGTIHQLVSACEEASYGALFPTHIRMNPCRESWVSGLIIGPGRNAKEGFGRVPTFDDPVRFYTLLGIRIVFSTEIHPDEFEIVTIERLHDDRFTFRRQFEDSSNEHL